MGRSGGWAMLLWLCVCAIALGIAAVPARADSGILIEAEDYQSGGEGIGFHETTRDNRGNAPNYRRDAVDISRCNAGCSKYHIAFTAVGEWLRYDVHIPASGRYRIIIRETTPYRYKRLKLTIGGVALPEAEAAWTGGWNAWTDWVYAPDVALRAGRQKLRLEFVRDGVNVDSIRLVPLGEITPTPGTPTPTGTPGTPTPTATPGTPTPTATPGTPVPGPDVPLNQGPWFQIVCALGQRRNDDPIVFPGEPGRSHEHQFFGNTGTDAGATYERLIRRGTTCRDTADTAAYWIPVLYDERGIPHAPRRVRAYYYANSAEPGAPRSFPPDLRVIAGSPRATGPQPRGVIEWLCRNRASQAAGLPLAADDPPRCRDDEYLSLSVRFPDCWDGQHLDSPDHQSHMAYADARRRCPASHPVKLPKLRLSITYEDGAFSGGAFTLGAPRGDPMALAPYAMHADFWNIWQPPALDEYVTGCLQRRMTVRGTACRP